MPPPLVVMKVPPEITLQAGCFLACHTAGDEYKYGGRSRPGRVHAVGGTAIQRAFMVVRGARGLAVVSSFFCCWSCINSRRSCCMCCCAAMQVPAKAVSAGVDIDSRRRCYSCCCCCWRSKMLLLCGRGGCPPPSSLPRIVL